MFTTAQEKHEKLVQQWTMLQSLWNGVKDSVTGAANTEIEDCFKNRSDFPTVDAWSLLNRTQALVGGNLASATLTIEYGRLLDEARRRKLASLATHEANADLFKTVAVAGTDDLAKQRAAYLALLNAVQSDAIDLRYRRRVRLDTANRLNYFGLWVLALAAVPPLVFAIVYYIREVPGHHYGAYLFSTEPWFGLLMVATFGLLGAYFSRSTAFQGKLETFDFEDVAKMYQPAMLCQRLLYGMIGAVMFYFLLRSALLQGVVFPDLSKLSIDEMPVLTLPRDTAAKNAHSGNFIELTVLLPTLDLAKLIVWSFIAGFSERLVPDAIGKTEARATATTN